MSLSTILRRGVGLQLEVMTEPSAGALAEKLVAFAQCADDAGRLRLTRVCRCFIVSNLKK